MKRTTVIYFILLSYLGLAQDSRFLPNTHLGYMVAHQNYILSYVEKYEGPEWITYELTYEETRNNVDRKTGKFLEDKSIPTGSAVHNDYNLSGYDRGHLAPAGDMNFSADAEYESFYMSNVLPQTSELNRKTWKYLEDDIREYVIRTRKSLYIITGGIWSADPQRIGLNRVAVPSYFYKIIFDGEDHVLAFIMPNTNSPNLDYSTYSCSVDEIQMMINIVFFPDIGNKNYIEKTISKNWLK